MKAIRIDGQTPGGARTPLAQAIPLSTPYMIQIFPVYACNFKCNYCIHSIPKEKRGYISDKTFMDFDLYKKYIDDLSYFPQKIKMLRFAGTGEPLLHKDIAKMVEYAVKKQVAECIDIVTNGVLLTPQLSIDLINAGLSKLRISIQGINAIKYKEVTQVNIDFDKFLMNLKYFYQHRAQTHVYIKVIDCALDKDQDKVFFDIFGDVCDTIAIEHVLPAVSQIDYEKSHMNSNANLTQNGNCVLQANVCPQPFYLMQINPEGNVVPCCAMETSYVVDNCNEHGIYEIWNSKRYNIFRQKQLLGQKEIYAVCEKCKQYKYTMFTEDILDSDSERLLKLFK